MSLRDKSGGAAQSSGLGFSASQTFNAAAEPEETVIASKEAVYIYAGRLEDGTVVVRDAGGVLHALVPVRKTCDAG